MDNWIFVHKCFCLSRDQRLTFEQLQQGCILEVVYFHIISCVCMIGVLPIDKPLFFVTIGQVRIANRTHFEVASVSNMLKFILKKVIISYYSKKAFKSLGEDKNCPCRETLHSCALSLKYFPHGTIIIPQFFKFLSLFFVSGRTLFL